MQKYDSEELKLILSHLKQPQPEWCFNCTHKTIEENLRCKACRVPPKTVVPYRSASGKLEAIEIHKPIKKPPFFEAAKGSELYIEEAA